MNVRANTVYPHARKRGRSANAMPLSVRLGIIAYLLVMCALTFGIVNWRVSINQQIDNVQKENRLLEQEYQALHLEINKLYKEKETLSSRANIDAKIAEFNLKLRLPDPQQVQPMTITRITDANGRTLRVRQARRTAEVRSGSGAYSVYGTR